MDAKFEITAKCGVFEIESRWLSAKSPGQ